MKLSIYAFMFGITISSLSYGMDQASAPAAQTQKKDAPKKAANTMTSQEVSRLTLCAIAQKQLGAPKQ